MAHVCDLCNVHCSSAALLTEHCAGKKHVQAAEQAARRLDLSKRSVFLANFHTPFTSAQIEAALSGYGEVERILPDKRANATHAIVEFRSADGAQKLLSAVRKLEIGENIVNVRERRMEFDASKLQNYDEFSCQDVLSCLEGISTDENYAQVDALILRFSLDAIMGKERILFAQQLSSFLRQFFATSVCVHVFGSSTTGLAFFNSDLDLNLVLPNDECDSGENDNLPSSSHRFVALERNLDVDFIVKNPLSKTDFLGLSNHERLHFLTKLVNKFRKETGNIANIVSAFDARYPVVRFDLRTSKTNQQPKNSKHTTLLSCELTIENLFSERKANFVKDVCDSDISGNLRKFLFVIKLWAYCNNLFAKRTDESKKTCKSWKSYIFSLLAISFLQSKGILSKLVMLGSSAEINGWKVDYILPKTDLSLVKLPNLLKDFFTFLYNTIRDSNVHCVRHGVVYSKAEFEQNLLEMDIVGNVEKKAKRFKISMVNVQDPLELSHNVAGNVSREALSQLRRALMFSIVALKQRDQTEDLSAIFRINELEMQFAATTEGNSLQNATHRKLANILTIPIDEDAPAPLIFESFSSLVQDILLLNVVDEPPLKRSRQATANNEYAEEIVLCGGIGLQFMASFSMWLGRRQLRRKLSSNLVLSPLLLEKEVSKELRAKSQLSVPFCFGVQLYVNEPEAGKTDGAEIIDDASNTPSENSTNTKNVVRELHVVFRLPEESQQNRLCRDLLHFLSTFLPKHMPLILADNAHKSNKWTNEMGAKDLNASGWNVKLNDKSVSKPSEDEVMEIC